MPEEPLTLIDEMAGSCHEIFLAMTRAGFTELQACVIVAHIIMSAGEHR